jgi:DNA-binding NarL/FixJ family response regulator
MNQDDDCTQVRPLRARLIIVDDHDLSRAGLRKLLEGARDLVLVSEATSGQHALNLCQRLQPDLVIMDVRLPDMDGLTATRAIRRALPHCRVLLFTMYEAADYMREAVRAGASGYILKGASRRELLNAVRAALRTAPVAPVPDDQSDVNTP